MQLTENEDHWRRAASAVLRYDANCKPAHIEWVLSKLHFSRRHGGKPTSKRLIEILERDRSEFQLRPRTPDDKFDFRHELLMNHGLGRAQARAAPRGPHSRHHQPPQHGGRPS